MAPKDKAAAIKGAAQANLKNPEFKVKGPKKEKKEEEEEKPKVPAPDKVAFDAKMDEIQRQIEAFQKEQKGFQDKISERSHGKEEFFAAKAALRGQLDEYSGHLNRLQEAKDSILKAHGDKQAEGREMKAQLQKMKKSIGYTDEAEIDNRIASIEFKLWTDTLTLKEEKKLLAEIQELKRNRPKVSQVKQMEGHVETYKEGTSSKEQLSDINGQMFEWREKKRAISEKLSALNEERKSQMGDLPQILEERDAIGKKIQEQIRKKNELRDAFRAEEREYNAYLYEQRKARADKMAEERRVRQAEWEQTQRIRKAEKLDDQPHVAEITLIEQTMLFCRTLTQEKKGEREEKKESSVEAPDGMQLLTKKEDRDEFYFAPTKKKAAKGKKGGAKEGGKAIKHNAETFRLFDQLKLDAPITTDDIPALMEKLEAQLESYKEKVKTWELKREEMKKAILAGTDEEEKKEEAAEEAKEEAAADA